MLVSDILTSANLLDVRPDDSLEHAMQRMDENDVRHLPVIESRRLIGMISERDLLEATGWTVERAFDMSAGHDKTVRDTMQVAVVTAAPDDDLPSVAKRLRRNAIGCLPVVADEAVVGVLTTQDVLRAFAAYCRSEAASTEVDPPVSTAMTETLVTIDHAETVKLAIERSRAERVRHLPVMSDGWFVGVVSDRDLRRVVGQGRAAETRVGDILQTDIISIGPQQRLSEAVDLFLLHRFGALPVLEERRLVGILSASDVLEHCSALDW